MTDEVKTLLLDARKGITESQALLAARYWEGNGVRKSALRAIWWFERAQYVHPIVSRPDYLAANYAGISEEMMLQMCPPLHRFLLEGVRRISAWQAQFAAHKEPDYILSCVCRKLRKAPGALASCMKELAWEVLLVVAPVVIVAIIVLLFR